MTTESQDNKMTVKLISASHDNLIEEVAMMARVSNPSNQIQLRDFREVSKVSNQTCTTGAF